MIFKFEHWSTHDQVLNMDRVKSWAVLSYVLVASHAQEEFGEEMDQIEEPVDLESLTEDSKRLYQHPGNAFREEAFTALQSAQRTCFLSRIHSTLSPSSCRFLVRRSDGTFFLLILVPFGDSY